MIVDVEESASKVLLIAVEGNVAESIEATDQESKSSPVL